MSINQRIGIIGGNGWLGSALIRGAVSAGTVDPSRLCISSRSGNRGSIADIPALRTQDNATLIRESDVVVIAVRPDQFRSISLDLRDKLVLSVMAGVRCSEIAARTGAQQVVRTLPNAAAAIGRSFSPWYATQSVGEGARSVIRSFLSASGESVEAPDEYHIDYCGALTGSGAAYPAFLAVALADAAVAAGLTREFADKAAKSLLCNATQLFSGDNGSPAAIVQEMINYRGMIAAALDTMTEKGFRQSISDGLKAAMSKS